MRALEPVRPSSVLRGAVVLALLLAAPRALAQDWSWAEGREVTRVDFEGQTTLNKAELKSMISTREGEDPVTGERYRFSSEMLAQDLARLYRSGQFASP